jgi:predicted GIY-YIG superfamily endonuclease
MNLPMALNECYKNISGIYQIRNIINNHRYIGFSTNIYRRCSDHYLHLLTIWYLRAYYNIHL